MEYTIKQVSLDDEEMARQAVALLRTAFELKGGSEQLRKNTRTTGAQDSFYLAAMQGNEVIGFNGFIAHDLLLEGSNLQAYQSCWTATHPKHRGKSVFPNLVLAAHEVLRERGAAFLLGFPNPLSLPLFIKKLSYRELRSLKWQMPHFPLGQRSWFNTNPPSVSDIQRGAVGQNDAQLIQLKQGDCGDAILIARHEGSVAWGIRRRRHGPLTIRYLDVGGIELRDSAHLWPLLHLLRRKAGPTSYTQLVLLEGASFNQLLSRVAPSTSNPLVIHDINGDSRDYRFNLMCGVRDVFTG